MNSDIKSLLMRKILNTLAALALVVLPMAMASCSDNTGESDDAEFANWRNRNAAFYDSLLAVARTDVAQAKAAHPDNWQAYTPWRLLPSFSKPFASQSTDTVVARVIESAATPGMTPYYTDSVRVNYIGHLMPTKSYPKGRVFDHSGVYENESYVFSAQYSTPTSFAVSNLVEGYTTALMHMQVGDRWLVYIPQQLGYRSSASGVLLPYSTLCFDMQLKKVARKGHSLSE